MTIWYPLLVALFWAFVLSLIFSAVSGRNWPRGDAGWGGIVLFFLIVWLATWGIGAWITPAGPTFRGVPWLWFLFLAIIFALILSASAPPVRRPRTPAEAAVQSAERAAEEEAAAAIFSLYFWVLLVLLALTLVARYAWWRH